MVQQAEHRTYYWEVMCSTPGHGAAAQRLCESCSYLVPHVIKHQSVDGETLWLRK